LAIGFQFSWIHLPNLGQVVRADGTTMTQRSMSTAISWALLISNPYHEVNKKYITFLLRLISTILGMPNSRKQELRKVMTFHIEIVEKS
jgi:hypothetical protein